MQGAIRIAVYTSTTKFICCTFRYSLSSVFEITLYVLHFRESTKRHWIFTMNRSVLGILIVFVAVVVVVVVAAAAAAAVAAAAAAVVVVVEQQQQQY